MKSFRTGGAISGKSDVVVLPRNSKGKTAKKHHEYCKKKPKGESGFGLNMFENHFGNISFVHILMGLNSYKKKFNIWKVCSQGLL